MRCRLAGSLLLSAVLGCKASSGAIHFVGLTDSPCPGRTGADAQAASAAPATMLFGTVPLRVAPWGRTELRRVEIKVGDERIALPSPTAVHSLDTTKRPDGDLTLTAEAEDSEGSSLSTQVRVCLDNHAPHVALDSPAEGALIWAEDAALAVRWKADDLVGLKLLRATLTVRGIRQEKSCVMPDATGSTSCTLAPVEMPLKLPAGGEEQAELTVLAQDLAGHEASVTRALRCKTRLLWSLDAEGSVRWPVELLGQDRLAVATDVGRVLIVEASTHKLACPAWVKSPEEDPGFGITTPLAGTKAGTQLYFASYYNLWRLSTDCKFSPAPFYSLSLPPDGNKENKNRWWFNGARPAIKESSGPPIILVALSAAKDKSLGVLRAIDGDTGVEIPPSLNLTSVDSDITGSPVLSEDGTTVFVGTPESKLHAVAVSATGQLSFRPAPWPVQTRSGIRARPLLLGGHLYVSTVGGELLAFDTTTAAPLAGFPLALDRSGPLAGSSSAAGADMIYVGSAAQAGLLFGVRTTGGKASQLAIGQMDVQGYPVVSFAGGEPVVYAAAQVVRDSETGESAHQTLGRLYALAPDLSSISWYFEAEREFIAPPAVRGTTIYIGNANGLVYALDGTR